MYEEDFDDYEEDFEDIEFETKAESEARLTAKSQDKTVAKSKSASPEEDYAKIMRMVSDENVRVASAKKRPTPVLR